MIEIDGSQGEGGGQVLRTSLALSILTKQPFRIRNIRAGRAKPGLLRQHLTGVRAAAEISGATVTGDDLGSREVTFQPGDVAPGDYRFAVGTAGSANLVLQTVLWPLALASAPSRLVLEGGTHNPASPPFHYLHETFAPIVARMGVELGLELTRWGFYPAGGGRIVATIAPAAKLERIEILERGEVVDVALRAAVAVLPENIARRELVEACKILGRDRGDGRVVQVESQGPGNVMWIVVACEHATEVFTGFGEKGVPSEVVGGRCAREAKAWIDAGVPVGEHTADQLLIPMALAGGGAFRTAAPSLHTRTNADVVRRFVGVDVALTEDGDGWLVRVG